jgi:putative peptidoglycan lipid II flippase
MVALLRRGSGRYGDVARFDDRFRARIWRIVAASVIMGVVLWWAAAALGPWLALPWWRALVLAFLVLTGVFSYFAAGQLLGAFRLSELKAALRRGT